MPRPSSVLTRPLLLGLLVTALGCGLAYWLIGMPPLLGAEDAAIGFRYARNLAEGHGIVFNPGGERVEGVTSLSWLFVAAAIYAVFGAAGLEQALGMVGLALTVVTITIVVRLLEHVSRAGAPFWIGMAWLAGQAGFWFWAGLSLMDVAPWAAGMAALVLLVHRRLAVSQDAREAGIDPPARAGAPASRSASARAGLASVVAFLALTRPEAMTVVPGAVAAAAFAYGRSPRLRRVAVDVLVTLAIAVGGLTLFRLAYFGFPLPNTYYMKVSPDVPWRVGQGLLYLWDYVRDHPLSWLAVAAGGGALAARGARWARRDTAGADRPDGAPPPALSAFVTGVTAVGFASVVLGGGDHYLAHRFLAAYLPLAAVPIACALAAARHALEGSAASVPEGGGRGTAHGRRRARTLGLVAVVAVVLVLPSEWATYRSHQVGMQAFDTGLKGRFVGGTLDAVFDGPKPELGLWLVGGASYAYHGPVKDLLGLNWIAMGTSPGDRKGPRDHAAFNADVFWSDPPELMIPELEAALVRVRCVRALFANVLDGLLTSPRFVQEFEPVRVQRGESEPIIAYARSDWLLSAPASVERLGWAYCMTTR